MRFFVAGAAKRYAVSGLELRLSEERLSTDMMCGEASARVAIHAPVSITFPDELAPSA
jgi:hypothetical protein